MIRLRSKQRCPQLDSLDRGDIDTSKYGHLDIRASILNYLREEKETRTQLDVLCILCYASLRISVQLYAILRDSMQRYVLCLFMHLHATVCNCVQFHATPCDSIFYNCLCTSMWNQWERDRKSVLRQPELSKVGCFNDIIRNSIGNLCVGDRDSPD